MVKWGLGQSYDRVQYIPKKLRAYIDLTKPASSVGVGLGYFIASLFYFYGGGHTPITGEKLFSMIYVSVTILLAHSASQAMNMAEDAEMDRDTPHKQDRPIPSGIVSEDEARSIAWIMAALALGRGFMVNWRFGIFTTILVFMGIFYNLAPVRAKERIISIPWQAASRGLFTFPAVWSAYGNPFAPEAWALGLFLFFYVLGFQNSADIIDREVDAEYGVRTFVVEFGVKNTVLIAFGSLVAMMTVLSLSILAGTLDKNMISLAIVLPIGLYMVREMWENPYRVSDKTGNHPAWLWFYGGLVVIIATPLATEIVV